VYGLPWFLAIVMTWLTGCATAGFEASGVAACPPLVEYSREFQARAAEELAMLPDGSAIVEMLSDYAVMREQARPAFHEIQHQNPSAQSDTSVFREMNRTFEHVAAKVLQEPTLPDAASCLNGGFALRCSVEVNHCDA